MLNISASLDCARFCLKMYKFDKLYVICNLILTSDEPKVHIKISKKMVSIMLSYRVTVIH